MRSIIVSFIDNAIVDSTEVSDVHNPEMKFRARINYHIDSICKKGQQVVNYGSHAMVPLTFLANADERSFPAKRYNDIKGPYAYTLIGSEEYVQPDKDLMPFILPENDSLITEFFDFRRIFTRDGNTVRVNWTFRVNETVIPKEHYQNYVNSYKKLKEIAMWNISYFEPMALSSDAFSNDTPQAIMAFCCNALRRDPGNVILSLIKGLTYNEMQMPDSSIVVFSDILRNEPKNKYAHLWMASPLFSLNKPEDAMAHIDEAIRSDPDFKEAYFFRASIFQDAAMPVNSLQDYESYINIDKGNKVVWLNKGYLLYQLGRSLEAIDAFQNAAKIDPKDATIQAALADTYLRLDKYEEAVKFYMNAIQVDPKTSRNYGNLGWAYYLLNDDWKCIEYSLKAIKLDPQAYFARYNMALAYLRSGFYEEALKHYRELAKEQRIPSDQRAGAISDLRTLQSKGIRVAETAVILKDCFGL